MTSANQTDLPWILDAFHAAYRNLFLYDATDHSKLLGGLMVTAGMTNENLYDWVEIYCVFTAPFNIHNNNQHVVERNGNALVAGNYYIVSDGKHPVYLCY